MAGQKFQYDESGSTFVYFLLSFLALILVPATYYSWPRKEKQDPEKAEKECRCEHCLAKKARLVRKDPWQLSKKVLVRLAIFLGWVLFFYAAYQTSKYDYEYANFDPYEILQIELGSSPAAIKKAYHKLSLIHHPDKETGDEKAFMRLTKAYQALTDETARRNWELYGNPDGPGAMSFGIALPSWIVEKENSLWVLGLYALVFMVALPTAVGTWWYRSIRYSGEQVLLDTTQMYYYFFHKTPQMVLKRTIMILAASAEFYRRHNPEIHERPSDNVEVPYLIKILPQLNEKNKERPLCFAYSVKARALLHAHLSRLQLPPNTLEIDRLAVIRKCPVLIQEMVVCVSQLIMLAHAGRLSRMPALTTIEGCMKLSQMIVQALWEHKSPFLQLPHIDDDSLKYFSSKRHQVRSLEQLARMKEDERRFLLRHLNDTQYEDVIRVLGQMPYIDMDVVCEVVDDEHTTVYTAGAIITVTVTLTRKPMESLFDKEGAVQNGIIENGAEGIEEDDAAAAKKKPSPWQRGPKKSKKSSSSSKKGTKKPATKTSNPTTTPTTAATTATTTAAPKKEKDSDQESESGSEESDQESQEESQKVPANQSSAPEDDDEEDWSKFQEKITNKRQKVLEGRSKVSHSVHCPFFSDDKQEYWWVYISDRKQQLLLTAPYHVTNLVDREEVQLKFTAPMKPGNYTFAVVLKSDSYMGFDQMKDIKMDVKEAPAVPTEHPQWDISDDEEEKKDSTGSESEFATDDEDADLDQDD